jgi:hypothetical protein
VIVIGLVIAIMGSRFIGLSIRREKIKKDKIE